MAWIHGDRCLADRCADGRIADQHAVGGLADHYAGSPPVTALQSLQGPIPPRGPAAAEGHRLPPPWARPDPQWPARSDPMRSRSTKRYFQQLFALYAGLVGAR
ncbi:MAG TPA: hypothetical protein DCM50_08130 [Stenotrophomonas sp.]|nr:hypothetical protein [Stenotrophomonas sp.]